MHPEALNDKNKDFFLKLKNFPDFYLAGGTALALQLGHRISVDFDLFSNREIPDNLFSHVKKIFSDSGIVVSVNTIDELTILISGVKLTFIRYPFPVLFDFAEYEGVKLLNPKEIMATKAYTIGRRGSFKDYVDFYFSLSQGLFSLQEIIETAEKKFGTEFNARLFLEQLVYMEDVEEEEIIFLKNKITKKELEVFFESEVKKIRI